MYSCTFQVVSYKGYHIIVQFLFINGADINQQGNSINTSIKAKPSIKKMKHDNYKKTDL